MSIYHHQIQVSEFKAKCLQIMNNVHEQQISIIITKRGKPIAKLVPIEDPDRSDIFGCMAGSITINDDIISPIEDEWDANA